MWKLKDITYLCGGPPPSLLIARWFGVESHVPPIGPFCSCCCCIIACMCAICCCWWWCHLVKSYTWVWSVFWISPVWISNPLRWVLRSSHPEIDCHDCTGGGSPLESNECTVPDPPVSCVCRMCSQPGWCMGVNPGTCPVGNIWGAAWTGCGSCGCALELLPSFLVRLLVTLPDIDFLRASSCETRGKVSVGESYKRSPRLGN
jgi:hypothetical protein